MSELVWRPAGRTRIGTPTTGRRRRIGVWTALAVLTLLVGAALLAPLLFPGDQRLVDLGAASQAPSVEHPLGTDKLGRDLLVRSLYGLRVSLTVGVVAAAVATVIGGLVGLVAGVAGGWVDWLLMRLVDGFGSLPHLLLGIFIVAMFAPGVGAVIVSIGVTHWLTTARIVRAEVLSLRSRTFVDAAISDGATRWRILVRHLLPAVVPQLGLAAVLMVPHAVWHESALSFLGLGLPPHLASLGNMINDGRGELFAGAWWPSLVPGLFIIVPTLAIAVFSGWWRDRLNPRRRTELQL
ncbi:ABC transporter permease [Micromonospora polyrhachis]|uniref:Peptide/nickel transport system permease protein n=1 Tax=Micromonospora polyrhachis TaxID=1282883 RepID=A0A7W7SM80_9ACTN|nr:ABC transporter permease [Micromonospora polyrhachis]MBB4956787.1 peptide/nickel transport system permease protein [Micromonospora polyrhachis]